VIAGTQEAAEQRVDRCVELGAGFGEPNAASLPADKLRMQRFLEPTDRPAQDTRSDAEDSGGFHNAAVLRDCRKVLQLSQLLVRDG
jgi:hypothetical protein